MMTREELVERAIRAVHEREEAFGEALDADADAEHTYKVARAKAFLTAQGTEKAREAQSVIDTDNLLKDHLNKKAVKTFCAVKLNDAQDALSARQSLLKRETSTNFGSMGVGA